MRPWVCNLRVCLEFKGLYFAYTPFPTGQSARIPSFRHGQAKGSL